MDNLHDTLGEPVPARTAHAISVSLPAWADNVGYVEAEPRVLDAMTTGYPRFVIHKSVRRLARIVEKHIGHDGEDCLLLQTAQAADECRKFLIDHSARVSGVPIAVRLAAFPIYGSLISSVRTPEDMATLHATFFPAASAPLAKQFWQHTGMGITSRFAEHCLGLLFPDEDKAAAMPWTPMITVDWNSTVKLEPLGGVQGSESDCDHGGTDDLMDNVEAAKRVLRRRIASLERGHGRLADEAEDDVYLFPTGMQAIFAANKLAQVFRPGAKSVCFGFSYTDTLKVLEKFGPGCTFLAHGSTSVLADHFARDDASAVFTEVPSNPMLRTPDIAALRGLTETHDTLLIVDATIGNMYNVDILPHTDVVIHSLSKIFSGAANVTGGSLMLNRAGRHYARLKQHLDSFYEDSYFGPDALVMERNCRELAARIPLIDANAEAVADWLRARACDSGLAHSPLREAFYPKWTNRTEYDAVRRRSTSPEPGPTPKVESNARSADGDGNAAWGGYAGGFGGLLSLTFSSLAASAAFYDALTCYKGPSLGTRFTLACPYTIIAHYREMDWAAGFGVEEGLVRISVGCEERERLLGAVRCAFEAAQEVVVASQAGVHGREESGREVEDSDGAGAEGCVWKLPAQDVEALHLPVYLVPHEKGQRTARGEGR